MGRAVLTVSRFLTVVTASGVSSGREKGDADLFCRKVGFGVVELSWIDRRKLITGNEQNVCSAGVGPSAHSPFKEKIGMRKLISGLALSALLSAIAKCPIRAERRVS